MLVIAAIIIGVLMVFCPQLVMKKEWKDDADKIKRARIFGIIVIVLGIILMFM